MENKIFVTKAFLPPMEEYIAEISSLWETHWLTNMGAKHLKLQEELIKYLDVDNVELLTNGHMSLELTLQAMNLQGEVITTPFTFASTTHAIVRNGLEPVFCDIKSDDFTIDPEKIENLITDRTSAIMPVDVYGNVCDVEAIDRIAQKYELKVIYDDAHAFGVKYKGRGVGNYGDASCFSFHATKVFNTIEGGAVTFKDPSLQTTLYELKNFGIHGPEEVAAVGANAKMNEFCAAMGLCNLRHMNEIVLQRKAIVERYRERLSDVKGLQLSIVQKDVESNYAYFPIVVDEKVFGSSREDVMQHLENHNVMVRKYFYPLTSSYKAFHRKYDVHKTPVALHISKRVLALPIYPELSIKDVDRICDLILECKSI
ncbi:MAG: DegT/DnrJ/EryC1/StrS family aminotransferase [Clostridia bacterium]|nr:DegT/DnrJ/EryC1/StrS family aminotransferase [Clostridia bacterium]MBR6208201.1 DegT/DnrJ/EryC1/StrS family aminotransferase [Oscillospiraceae bacterium]MBR6860328.1 DegT/DnrJ/EryC1/StrS family aminotransferase [Acidaminococcaceae bacterium]